MNIESSGGIIDIENEISGAKGVMQWKDGFIKGIKSNRKGDEYDSKSGSYSPFMTALRRANKFYTNQKDNKGEYLLGDFNSEKIPHYIYKAYKKGRLDINEFDSDKQIQLWFMDTIMRGGKSREYLMGIMLGNGWSAKMLYNKIHHTKVKGNTNDLVQENSKKIFPQFKKIS